MKIILSPSKTQIDATLVTGLKFIPKNHSTYFSSTQAELTEHILSTLLSDNLERLYKDKANTYKTHYEGFEHLNALAAIQSYTGLVFKQLDLQSYGKSALNYLDQHLVILSALYGMTAAFDLIKPYRLDFQMKLEHLNLYKLWHDSIQSTLSHEGCIIDLASNEFSKMVDLPKITIHFREDHQGKLINKATFAKMARGQMLHIMIIEHVKTIKALKSITFDGYVFNASISDSNNLYFVRSTKL